MANGNGIKELLARVAEADREVGAAKTELEKKFGNAKRVIGGYECTLMAFAGDVLVRVAKGQLCMDIPADVLNNIGGWLKKHYGDSPEQTEG